MQGKDELSIAITFVLGFVGGFYFFLTGYAPYVEEVKEAIFVQDQDAAESLIVVAKQYGGCEQTGMCASFQLEYDGSYRYLSASILQGAVPVQGVLPRAVFNEVRTVTTPSRLSGASRPAPDSINCASYVDGVDYSYEIVRNGQLYVLDTCTTMLRQQPEMLNVFDNVWVYVGR